MKDSITTDTVKNLVWSLLASEMYEILREIADSTAVLNHLPVEHQEAICNLISRIEGIR